jgi:NSS family neurotransmitter:Na+ symporter
MDWQIIILIDPIVILSFILLLKWNEFSDRHRSSLAESETTASTIRLPTQTAESTVGSIKSVTKNAGSNNDKSDVPGSAKLVALMDTGVAFIAGLLILPAIFSFNPNTNTADLSDSSVGMIFTFLPKIFLALQVNIGFAGASIVASLFFLLVFFAAITSLVSIFEVPVAALMEDKGFSRKKSLSWLGLLLIIMAVVSATSFGLVGFFTEFVTYAGQTKSFFDVVIDVFYDTILPFNGLLICIFVIYRWKKINLNKELDKGSAGYKNSWFEKYVDFSVGTFIPVILLLVFINTVALKYFGKALIG